MNKQDAIKKLAELEEKAAELRAIIDKPEVKPLFPTSWEEGARAYVTENGVDLGFFSPADDGIIKDLAIQGRTFYTKEAAEAFAKRERARAYCLERINEVNEGDNGFKAGKDNWFIEYRGASRRIVIDFLTHVQGQESSEYIRTMVAVKQLINDTEFVEQWKIWKGVE